MPGYGQDKIKMIMDFDSGKNITYARHAMKTARELLQRPDTIPGNLPTEEPLTTEVKPDIIEDKVTKDKVIGEDGRGYDMTRALEAGLTPDEDGHWGSVAPTTKEEKEKYNLPEESYIILKDKNHETFDKTVAGEEARNFEVKKFGNRYYSVPNVVETIPLPVEEKINEEAIDSSTDTPGGYEPGKASNLQENLIQAESSGRYDIVNKEGFMGAYQFGNAKLTDYKTATNTKFSNDEFINSKELQDKVFKWHHSDIESHITKKKLDAYIGTEILDIEITRDGLFAVAHLGGKRGLEKFLESNGKYNPADSNGRKLSDYLNKFKGNKNDN